MSYFDIGFAISTTSLEGIRDGAEAEGITLTPQHWYLLNEGIKTIENNIVKWLTRSFRAVKVEGHQDDELVGIVRLEKGDWESFRRVKVQYYTTDAFPFLISHAGVNDLTSQLVLGFLDFPDFDFPELIVFMHTHDETEEKGEADESP